MNARTPKQCVVVGLSGGVDSAVSAYLLKKQGYAVRGVFMKNWEEDDDDAFCTSRQDFLDAASVADLLDIEIEYINFSKEYKDRVFSVFLAEYQAGRTPNPDILCNTEIKFNAFLSHACATGAEKIATGHYARVHYDAKAKDYKLLKGLDPNKDQSYFLHRLTQAQLGKTLFPLGSLQKAQVRQLATEIGLPNAKKKDSTGICFIGKRPFRAFLSRYIASTEGDMKDERGHVVGRHMGLSFYTLGQRQGLGIGGVKTAGSHTDRHKPWFVARKDLDHNTLWVVQGHDHPWLQSCKLHATDVSWVAGHAPDAAGSVMAGITAKTRYRQADTACTLTLASNGLNLVFAQPQWAVTPGQSAVLYQGECCLGGGVITTSDTTVTTFFAT